MADAENTLETITLQLAMAFGQGTGTMLASAAALTAALDPYRESLRSRVSQWDEFALQAIEYCRVLGQLAAYQALREGRCVIDDADVNVALQAVRLNRAAPLATCRITE